MTDYADYQINVAPTFMQRTWGRAWNYTLGLAKDAFVAAAKAAVKVRFAAIAPGDALDLLLRDYQLPARYNETETMTRSRLARAWASWQLAGTKAGILAALATAGYADVEVQERVDSERWWYFDVVLRPPFPWDPSVVTTPKIGAGWLIGGGQALSHGIPSEEQARVLSLIAKWKAAHAQVRKVVVVIDGPEIGSFTIGDGTLVTGTLLHWSI